MLHRDLVRGTRHNFECGTWNESGGRADRLRWHGGIVRTGYDERWRFDLRKKASRVMALDRCDSAGESGNCRGQDHRLSKIQQTLVDRSGKPCRIHDRHLRNEPAAAHCGHPLVPDRPSWLRNERTCCHECQRDKPVRSEEHTSELQSLMRISYDVFCLKQKITKQ